MRLLTEIDITREAFYIFSMHCKGSLWQNLLLVLFSCLSITFSTPAYSAVWGLLIVEWLTRGPFHIVGKHGIDLYHRALSFAGFCPGIHVEHSSKSLQPRLWLLQGE